MERTVSPLWIGIAAFALIAPLAGATGVAAAAPLVEFHGLHQGSTSSLNWAGFAVTGAKGSVTFVKGSWIVPKIVGKCPSGARYSSFWVGIDGFSSGSVEQTGTDSDCQHGAPTYYAWYEFYPKPSHVIGALTVAAGDTIVATVTYASSTFTTKITDSTTGKSSTASDKVAAARTSAEWIAEAPSSFTGVLPLADFGTVQFGLDYTAVGGSDNATVSGTNGAIGSFGHVSSITMVSSGGKTKAVPSALSVDKTSFTVAWKSAGP